MLLEEESRKPCQDERLVHLQPTIPGLRQRRKVYLREALHTILTAGPWATPKDERKWNVLRFWFDHFSDGKRIYVRERPRAKKSTADMAQLEPWTDEIWEVRSIDPDPSIRVFGSFIKKDVFVGLTWSLRKELNGYGGPKWLQAIQLYKSEWKSLFDCRPISGEYPNDYLSEAVILD
jgi:hypothetical protein